MIFLKIKATHSDSHSFKIFWKYHKDAKNMATERIDPNLLAHVNASLCNM